MEPLDENYLRNKIRDLTWETYIKAGDGVMSNRDREGAILAAAHHYRRSDELFAQLASRQHGKNYGLYQLATTAKGEREHSRRFIDEAIKQREDPWFYTQFESPDNTLRNYTNGTVQRESKWLTFREWDLEYPTAHYNNREHLYRYFEAHPPHTQWPRLLDVALIEDYRLPHARSIGEPYIRVNRETGDVSFHNLDDDHHNFTFSSVIDTRSGSHRYYMDGKPVDYMYEGSPIRHHSDPDKSTEPKVLAPIRNRPWFTRTNNFLHTLLSKGK